jgi:hypothetical protein
MKIKKEIKNENVIFHYNHLSALFVRIKLSASVSYVFEWIKRFTHSSSDAVPYHPSVMLSQKETVFTMLSVVSIGNAWSTFANS